LRGSHGLAGKYVITYIGGESKFDSNFAWSLFDAAKKSLPWVHFIVVGNVPKTIADNVTYVGAALPTLAAAYYRLSDLGVILRDTQGDPFLYDSVPLKIVQYSAARKPVLTFPIGWCEENQFPNVFALRDSDVALWCRTIESIHSTFRWTDDLDDRWAEYSWDSVAAKVYADLAAALGRQTAQSHAAAPQKDRVKRDRECWIR
jgi:hypothetical protein